VEEHFTPDSGNTVDAYRKAAEQGSAKAQSSLGIAYFQGRGVAQDYTQAARWCHKAAEQGVAQAQNNLGLRYNAGQGSGDHFGHYTVETQDGDSSLHTEQGITDTAGNTKIFDADAVDAMPGAEPRQPLLGSAKIPLPDATSAQAYQRGQIGKNLGKYDKYTNSCVDHVSNVLRAGGVEVPAGTGPQIKYLTKAGVPLK